MITLTVDYEVPPDRLITIKLPEAVRPGRHELLIVLEKNRAEKSGDDTNTKALMQFAGTVKAFEQVDGLTYQQAVCSEWN